jgi:O-antigen/teichoic acid export membrane protein
LACPPEVVRIALRIVIRPVPGIRRSLRALTRRPAPPPDEERVVAASSEPGELTTRTAKNSLYGFGAFLYPALVTLFVTPFVLHRLGAEGYGILSLASVVAGLLALLDFGMAPALVKFGAELAALPKRRRINDLMGAGLLFYACVGIVGGTALLAIGLFFASHLFHLSAAARPDLKFALLVAAGQFLLAMLLTALSSLPIAFQRFDIGLAVRFVLTSLTTALTVGALFLGLGLRGVIVAVALEPVAGLLLFLFIDARLVPGFRPLPRWDPPLLRSMFSFSTYAFAASVSGVILFQLDKLLLGTLSSVAEVTYYVVPGNLAQRLHAAVGALAAVLLPLTSGLFARRDIEHLRGLYTRATRLILLFLLSVAIPASVFAYKILQYWIGPSFAEKSSLTFRLLIATYALIALTPIPYYFALGSGRAKITAVYSAAAAALNVALMVVLIPRYGIVGAAVAYLVSTVTVPGFLWYVETRVLALEAPIWPRLLGKLAVPAAVQAGCCLLVLPLVGNLVELLALLLVTMPVLGAAYFGLGLSEPADRQLLARILTGRSRHAA